jgi:NtrC-family two-component system response regulator AlgB
LVATNRDLRAMVATREFRADLYYRLDAVTVGLSPLRDRLEDTAALTAHHNRLFGKHVWYSSRHALALMRNYAWPGNARELAHTTERATLLCENDRIEAPELVADATAASRLGPAGQSHQERGLVDWRMRNRRSLDRPTPLSAFRAPRFAEKMARFGLR